MHHYDSVISYRVDKVLLFAIEDCDAEEEEDEDDQRTIAKSGPRELAGTIGSVFESLDNSRHRVKKHDPMECRVSDIAKGIDDRRSVHPEGDKDAEEINQILIFGGERRNDESKS